MSKHKLKARVSRVALKGRYISTKGAALRKKKVKHSSIHRAAPYVSIYRPFRALDRLDIQETPIRNVIAPADTSLRENGN